MGRRVRPLSLVGACLVPLLSLVLAACGSPGLLLSQIKDLVNTQLGANKTVRAVALQADGKILFGGDFTTYNGSAWEYLARLDADGSIDPAFPNAATGPNDTVHAITVLADGKILIGGTFTLFDGTSRAGIAQLNADGSIDAAFLVAGGGVNKTVYAICVQADGKILIGGDFTTWNSTARNYLARLYADGSLDPAFAPTLGTGAVVRAIAVQGDGKILLGLDVTPGIARLNADGTADTAFNTNASAGGRSGLVDCIAVQSDGKIVVGGKNTNACARFKTDGSPDTTFDVQIAGNTGTVLTLAVQADGWIIVGGGFDKANGAPHRNIARLNAYGTTEPSFVGGTDNYIVGSTYGQINSLAVQADGRIIIGGDFTLYNGTARGRIARIKADGSLE